MIINVNDFDYSIIKNIPLQAKPKGNQAGRRKDVFYKDVICAFDIETTVIDEIEQSVMYIWQFQIGLDHTVVGRTWDEFICFKTKLMEQLKHGEWLVVFVHNLSYEFQFLRGIYDFAPEEVFALDSRKVLKCTMDEHFEYRCSYIHSNMSLDAYLKKMGVEHKKLDDFDYKIKRYSWTELTPREMEYCVNDVIGLVEALYNDIELEKDSLYTFVLTSTGLVRRDAKKAMRQVSHFFVKDQLPDTEVYTILRECFRGGNTHCNRFYAGQILKDVKSYDRSSSYPDVIVNCEFPIKKFKPTGYQTIDRLIELVNQHKALVFRIRLENISLIDDYWGCPYLSRDKCRMIKNGVYDNGRILKADYLETSLTDIDFKIMMSQYQFTKAQPFDIYYSSYGKLPSPYLNTVKDYYRQKTKLKGVKGQELYYSKAKSKLNSLYGMQAQDPVKQSIVFEDGHFWVDNKDISLLLERHNRKAFLAYQWGVWTTAWARLRLEEGIRMAGDGFVYCDTDSVKYIGDIDWTSYNEERKNDSLKNGAYADDPSGERHYMGVYEPDSSYDRFASLGAKKYVGEHDGHLEITIAGVSKKKGAKELEKLGGIEAFKTGLIFKDAGGSELKYNDAPSIHNYVIDGHNQPITSNVVIRDSTYTLGITSEYERIIHDARLMRELSDDLLRSLHLKENKDKIKLS